jgi:hypothetical protein
MAQPRPIAYAGFSIGVSAASPATLNAAGFAALTYSNVGNIENIGGFGRVYELVTLKTLDTRGTQKIKGSFDSGNLDLKIANTTTDAGLTILKSESTTDNLVSVKITTSTGDITYCQALVMGTPRSGGSLDDIDFIDINLAITVGAGGIDFVFVPFV